MNTLIHEIGTKTIQLSMKCDSNNMQVSLKIQRLTTEKEPLSGLQCSIIAVFDHS